MSKAKISKEFAKDHKQRVPILIEDRVVDEVNQKSVVIDRYVANKEERLFQCGGCDAYRMFTSESGYKTFIRIHGNNCEWCGAWKESLLSLTWKKSFWESPRLVRAMPKSQVALNRVVHMTMEEHGIEAARGLQSQLSLIEDAKSVISELTSSVAEQTDDI